MINWSLFNFKSFVTVAFFALVAYYFYQKFAK